MESEERRCARCHKIPHPDAAYDYFCNENCQRTWMVAGPMPLPMPIENITGVKRKDDTI